MISCNMGVYNVREFWMAPLARFLQWSDGGQQCFSHGWLLRLRRLAVHAGVRVYIVAIIQAMAVVGELCWCGAVVVVAAAASASSLRATPAAADELTRPAARSLGLKAKPPSSALRLGWTWTLVAAPTRRWLRRYVR